MSKKFEKFNDTDIYRHLGSLRKFIYEEYMNAAGKNRCFVFESSKRYLTEADILFSEAFETLNISKKIENTKRIINLVLLFERELNTIADLKQIHINKAANVVETQLMPLKKCLDKFLKFNVKRLEEIEDEKDAELQKKIDIIEYERPYTINYKDYKDYEDQDEMLEDKDYTEAELRELFQTNEILDISDILKV